MTAPAKCALPPISRAVGAGPDTISSFALDEPCAAAQNHGFVATLPKHDAPALEAAIDRVAAGIAQRHAATPHLLLLGIANGGIVLAQRLAARLKKAGLKPGLGTIDISFHRDDIGCHPIPKEFSPTIIPHDVNGATVVLVDDVLHSGRTVKAALDELFDHGRPATVELAVLIDRGGRKLPVAAKWCGLAVNATDAEKVVVRLDPHTPAKDTFALQPARRRTATPFPATSP